MEGRKYKFTLKDYNESLIYNIKGHNLVSSLMKDWYTKVNTVVDKELKDYLENVHGIDTERLKEYSTRFSNIKLTCVDIKSETNHLPDGTIYTEWFDGDILIFATKQSLIEYTYTFDVERYWRTDG